MRKTVMLFVVISGMLSGQALSCCPGNCCLPIATNNALSLLNKYDKDYVAKNSDQIVAIATTTVDKNSNQEKNKA